MESWRVLKKGKNSGLSADNLQTRITDWVAEENLLMNKRISPISQLNLTRGEFISTKRVVLNRKVFPVENINYYVFPFRSKKRTSMKTKQDPKVINHHFWEMIQKVLRIFFRSIL